MKDIGYYDNEVDITSKFNTTDKQNKNNIIISMNDINDTEVVLIVFVIIKIKNHHKFNNETLIITKQLRVIFLF